MSLSFLANRTLKVPGCCSSAPSAVYKQRHRVVCQASEQEDANGKDVDIDKLARQLSSEAQKRRETLSNDSSSSGRSFIAGDVSQGHPSQIVGPPCFQANDFVIYDKLGSLSVRVIEQNSVLQSLADTWDKRPPSVSTATQQVNIYSASYESGKPFQGPVTVLLKEFTPMARPVGINELVIANTLDSLPDDANLWKAASGDMLRSDPVTKVIGWFESNPVDSDSEQPLFSEISSQSLWLVCRFEGLQPAQAYLATSCIEPTMRLPFALSPKQKRFKMLQSIFQGCLRATAHLHGFSIAHQSIGVGAFMMSTIDDSQASNLVIKLDNLGVAQSYVGDEESFEQARKQDCEALAVTFCELAFGSLYVDDTKEKKQQRSAGLAFQRLLLEVFQKDVAKFQDYCEGIKEWEDGVEFFSQVDGSGWDLLDTLLQGSSSCEDLEFSPFLS